MEQKEIIEQVFKDAFKEFSPDVSPNVWSGISNQLAQPVAPSAQPSGSLVKVAAAKLGTATSWIIGGIAAIAITAGVLLYNHNDISTKKSVTLTQSMLAVQNKNVENLPENEISSIENLNQTINAPQKNKSAEKSVTTKNPVIVKVNDEQNKPNTVDHNNHNSIDKTDATSSVNPSIEKSTTEDKTQNSPDNSSETSSTVSHTNDVTATAPPLILVNSSAGFAPMQVACLLNKEDRTGDWDFGDGASLIRSNSATHKYTKAGTYTLQCTSEESILTKTIEVIGQINTVFSPNGDGINDYFYVEATNLKSLSVHIFDRNGRKLVLLKTPEEKWDGRLSNGDIALAGTYFYELTAITENGKEIKQRGAINIFR